MAGRRGVDSARQMSDPTPPGAPFPPDAPVPPGAPVPPLPPGWSPGPPATESIPAPPGPYVPAPPPGYGLHPMGISRIVQLTFSIVRFGWRPLFGSAALILVPTYALVVLVNAAFGRELAVWSLAWQLEMRSGAPRFDELPPMPLGAMIASWVVTLLAIVAGVLAGGAIVAIVARIYAGGRATALDGVRAAFGRLGSLIGSQILFILGLLAIVLVGMLVGVGLIFAGSTTAVPQPGLAALIGLIIVVATFVATVFVALRWSFVVQAIVVEGFGALDGLGRSWRLIAGSTWRVLGYFLFFGLLATLLSVVLGVIGVLAFGTDIFNFSMGVDPWTLTVQAVVSGLAGLIMAPLWGAALTLLYYDVRWRREVAPGAMPPPAYR